MKKEKTKKPFSKMFSVREGIAEAIQRSVGESWTFVFGNGENTLEYFREDTPAHVAHFRSFPVRRSNDRWSLALWSVEELSPFFASFQAGQTR